ncbi:MAG: hypothetical protein JW894_09220 [Bacteroidales bacterium]|nr:hypothetical protein [Bacteroidales bacterium]
MIETIGSLAKEEQLKTVEHYIMSNSFVLQNLEPFPGYHGSNLPTENVPDTFFLITTEEYSSDMIFRIADNIKHFTDFKFKASPGKICIDNDSYPFVRVRGLQDYKPVKEIQRYFMDAGIKYQKKKEIDAVGLIELRKVFILENVTENIFNDKEDNMHYLLINKQLSWGRFKNLTYWVKNNLDDNNFDAALAVVYGRRVYDMVRIYMQNETIERLEAIRHKYLEGIQRTE